MTVDRDEVRRVAALAKLEFSESEIDAFTSQFREILNYVEKLLEVDVEGVESTSQVSPTGKTAAPGREDEPRASLGADAALANAPDPGSGHFRVPKVI